ncbi:MAG: hypothetical protein V4678_00680 [Patescibacteria group bacterium]
MKIIPSYGAPRSRVVTGVCLTAAGMLAAMLLAQLYGFEDFPATLGSVLPFNDQSLTAATAAGVIFLELLALPYLLGMYISKLMRIVSAAAAAVVSALWLMVCFTNSHALNSGLFSTTLEVPGGLLAALWSVVLFGLIAKVLAHDSRFRHTAAS